MHDATHYRFLKNRKWNDLISNITTMYPLFSSIEKYRENHLRHHQHLNTEDDPDWVQLEVGPSHGIPSLTAQP